jgi:probable rRNA maturation factor
MPRFPISFLYEDAPKGVKLNPYKVPNSKDLQKLARKVAEGEKLQGGIDIVFCSDEKVRELNKAYRKLDKVTDVLSFEWHEDDFAGEIFIATAQTQRQAPRFNNNYENELRRVVVHGVLHLCGYDHMKTGERNIMRAKEDFYLGVEVGAAGKGAQASSKAVKQPGGGRKVTRAKKLLK